MLLKIRDKATGWVAYAIVIVISIPFALWGIQQYFGLDSSPTVITVDDVEITEFQLEQAILEKKRQLEQAQIDPGIDEERIRSQVVSEMVSAQLLDLAIDKYRLKTTNQGLAEYIKNQPEFKLNQNFSPRLYQDTLTKTGYTVAEFERVQREILKEQQLISVIKDSSFVLPRERERYIYLAEQEREIRYLPVSYGYFIEPDSIDTEQAKAHYEQNKELYQSPYNVNFDYLEISLDGLIAAAEEEEEIDDIEVEEYYEQNADNYIYPEKFNLRHILVSTDERSPDEAFQIAERFYQQLEEGVDFAELAQEHSDDNLTAESGGELPELTAEELDTDAIREAVLQLLEGEFTFPIETPYGVQIFQLVKLTEAEQKSFDEVREELIEDLKYENAKNSYAELIEDLDILVFEAESNFFASAKQLYELEKQSTGFIDLNKEDSILGIPQVRSAVISEIAQGGKPLTGIVEVEAGKHFYVVGVNNVQPSVQLSFEDALQDIITDLTLAQAHQKIKENGEVWIKDLQAGNTSLETIAKENQWPIEEASYIRRTETSIPRPVVEKSFAILPSSKLPLYQAFPLDDNYNNDYIIMELLDIKAGVETSQTFTAYSLGNREVIAILNSLRDFHEVKVNLNPER